MNSKFFSWTGWDVIKGAVMAALAVILTAIYQILNGGVFPTTWAQWQPMLVTGSAAFIGYMIKNLFTNSAGQILSTESTAAAQALTAAKKANPALSSQTK